MTRYLIPRPDEHAAYQAWMKAHPHNGGTDAQQRAFVSGHRAATGRGPVTLMWRERAQAVHARLYVAGVTRLAYDCDLAIQSAREALAADEGSWRDPDSDRHWEVLEPHVLRFLDLTDTELAAVA